MAKRKTIAERNNELKPFGKQIINFGCKLNILPEDEQKILANKTFGCVRFVHNKYLADRQDYYSAEGKSLTVNTYKKETLVPLKATEDFSFLKEVDKNALESALSNVQDAYERFFKGQNKYPKFKKKGKCKKSYTTYETNGNIRIEDGNIIQLPKLGKVLYNQPKKGKNESKYDRLMSGNCRIVSATVSEKGGKYFVSLCLEEIVDIIKPVEIDKDNIQASGFDMGLKTLITAFDGENISKEENPRFFRKSEKKLAKYQRRQAKKKKGSNNFYKAVRKVNKVHTKISNQRMDLNHKMSKKYADENQICIVEDLNIKGMVKNHHLAKSISDAGWSQFFTFLQYKLERQGKIFLKIDRWFASSKICSSCGNKVIALSLNDREWACSCCGTKHDRDDNASINIRKKGLEMLGLA